MQKHKTITGSRFFVFSSLFILSSLSPLSAQNLAVEERLVTFEAKDRDLKELIDYIRQGSGANIVVDEGIQATVTLALNKVPWRQALDIAAEKAKCVVVELPGDVLKVEKPPVVHFAFENADITKVIDAIAKVSGANIIVGPEVKGTISIRLNDIPYRDALEGAVKTLGYVVVQEKRGILRITDPVTLKAQVESRAFQLRYIRPAGPYTPVIESDFISGPKKGGGSGASPGGAAGAGGSATSDAKKTFRLLEAFEKALSPNGRLDYVDRQNVLIVSDIAPVLERIQKMIERIDVEPKQIFVDVKFISTTNIDAFNFGIDYGSGGPSIGFQLSKIPIEYPFHMGNGGFEDGLIVHNGDNAGPFTTNGTNPGQSPGAVNIPSTVFGSLDFNQVQGTLHLLKSDANSDVIQAPKIIALDHQPATIFVGDRVPYAEAKTEQGQAGGLSLSVTEATKSPVSIGFQLLIIPHVVPGSDKIMMDIIPTQQSLTGSSPGTADAPAGFDVFTIGASGVSGSIALPRVSSSTIATTMILENGHTAVLGGLSTVTSSKTVRGVPVLKDLPFIGWLFKNENRSDDRRNLMVMITPTLIRSTEENDKLLEQELQEREKLYKSRFQEIFPSIRPAASAEKTETKPEGGN